MNSLISQRRRLFVIKYPSLTHQLTHEQCECTSVDELESVPLGVNAVIDSMCASLDAPQLERLETLAILGGYTVRVINPNIDK